MALLPTRCESNWVHALTSKGVEDVVCCSDSGGSNQPCYSGMGLSHELTSLKVRLAIMYSKLFGWLTTVHC